MNKGNSTSVLAGNSRTCDKFVIRLPDGMRERLAEVAKDQHRSMNSQIIGMLSKELEAIENGEPMSYPAHPILTSDRYTPYTLGDFTFINMMIDGELVPLRVVMVSHPTRPVVFLREGQTEPYRQVSLLEYSQMIGAF